MRHFFGTVLKIVGICGSALFLLLAILYLFFAESPRILDRISGAILPLIFTCPFILLFVFGKKIDSKSADLSKAIIDETQTFTNDSAVTNSEQFNKEHKNPYFSLSRDEVRALPEYKIIEDYISKLKKIDTKEFMSKLSPFDRDKTEIVLCAMVLDKKLVKISGDCYYYINLDDILATVDSMSEHGHDFEEFTVDLLTKNGFTKVRKTQGSGDYGIDVLAEKDGITYAIQCKCYSNTVGNKAVQEAYSGKSFYNCMIAVVFTNNYFTRAAIETAEQNNVLLWDRTKLIKFLGNAGY